MVSETRFLIKLVLSVLLTPLKLLGILFGKKNTSSLNEPLVFIRQFFVSAKATAAIIGILVVCFAISLFLSESMINQLVFRPSDFVEFKLWTLITASLLHANIAHLLGNLLALLIFGRIVEQKIGAKLFLLSYAGALVVSMVLTALVNGLLLKDNTPGLGASGAIMGVVALAMLLSPMSITYLLLLPLPIMVVAWIYIYVDVRAVLIGASDGVGHITHLAGFLAVTLLYPLLGKHQKDMKRGFIINCVTLLLALITFLLVKRSIV